MHVQFFSDRLLSIVHQSVYPYTFPILILFSRTTGPISTKCSTNHSWVNGIQVSNEKLRHFQKGHKSKNTLKKLHLLQNHWANFNQTWHKASSSKGNSKEMARSFSQKGDSSENTITKEHLQENLACKLTKLCKNHPWVRLIQDCSNKGPHLFQGEIIAKRRKYINDLKNIYCRTTRLISTYLSTKHSSVKGIQFFFLLFN